MQRNNIDVHPTKKGPTVDIYHHSSINEVETEREETMHTADEKKYPNARVLGTYQNLIINDGDLSLSYLWYKKMVDVLFS